MSSMDVIGIGALNMDHLYRVERILEDGESVVREALSSPGGSAANTIYGLAWMGVETGFVGAVGSDTDGLRLLDNLREAGVDVSRIRTISGSETGATVCLSDGVGRRSLYVSPAANSQFTAKDIDTAWLNEARIVHISSFADDLQFRAVSELPAKLKGNVKLSFSPGAIWAGKGISGLAPLLRRADVLFVNVDELFQITGKTSIPEGAVECLSAGCRMVAVTLGGSGKFDGKPAAAYVRDGEGEYVITPSDKPVEVVDGTGAGDAFAAGFLYGMLREKSPAECGRLGDTVARYSLGKAGARAGLPTRDDLNPYL